MFKWLFRIVVTIHFKNCFPFARQSVDSTGEKVTILGGDPRFNIVHQVIQIVVNFVRLPVFQRPIDVVVCRSFGRWTWRMWEQIPFLIGDRFDDKTFNMRTGVIVVEVDIVLFSWSFRCCCRRVRGGPIQPISTPFRAFWDDGRSSTGWHWSHRLAFVLSDFRLLPRLLEGPGRWTPMVVLFLLHLQGLCHLFWTSWPIFQLGFCWLFPRRKVRWDREMTLPPSNLSQSGRA